MNFLRSFVLLAVLSSAFGAGCSLLPEDTPIVTFEDCVAHGYPANMGLGQCRAHQQIYYKYGEPNTRSTNETPTTQW